MRKYHIGQRIMYRFDGVTYTSVIDLVSTTGEYVSTTLRHTIKTGNIVSVLEQAQAPASQTTEYKVGQEILYTYEGAEYADVIDHVPTSRSWVSTKYNQHFVDVEYIITPPLNISRVARPKTAEQLIVQPPRQPRPDLRTSYEESLTSMVNVYEMNRLHESISDMHRAHAIDLALDAGNVELFNTLTEGASSI